MSVRVFAPAKINLSLHVGCRRADGMHPLESAVVFADVGDWISATEAREASLAISGPFAAGLDTAEDNLVLAAARALAKAAGVSGGASLTLEKNLPVASGLGGGSADAAATLKALNQLWRLGYSEEALMRVGAGIGADVPVCLRGKGAWMTGAGEVIAALAAPEMNAILVNPLRPLSTAGVFRAFDTQGEARALSGAAAPRWTSRVELIEGARALGNDLTASAIALMPEIGDVLDTLQSDAGVAYAALSGSGATCFGLTESRQAATAAAAALTLLYPQYWIRAVRLSA